MRDLLYLFVLAALPLGLSTCSSYYCSMLNSDDPVGEKNERSDFVQEDNTVRISYRFWEENAPVTIAIYSKLNKPLYVDWRQSAPIIDDVATTCDPKVASVRGENSSVAPGSPFHWSDRNSSGWSYSGGSFSGDVSLPKGVEFIPPHSKLVNMPLQLTNFSFNETPKEEYVKEQITTRTNTTIDIRVKDFVEEGSPLKFRSYPTLFAGETNEKPLKHSSFERNFYLTKLTKVDDVTPRHFDEEQQQSGDFFYVREAHGTTVGLVVGAIIVTIAEVAIETMLGPVNY